MLSKKIGIVMGRYTVEIPMADSEIFFAIT